jgi:hypothetical protein
MQVSDIGLLFAELCLSPFLYTGATFAWFQSDGIFPDVKDFGENCVVYFCTYVWFFFEYVSTDVVLTYSFVWIYAL